MTTTRRKPAIKGVRFLTQAEGRQLLDRRTRETLGLSAEEFIAAWERGALDDYPDHVEIMRLAMLIPFATLPDAPDAPGA